MHSKKTSTPNHKRSRPHRARGRDATGRATRPETVRPQQTKRRISSSSYTRLSR